MTNTAPARIQRRRTKGSKMPASAVYVGRGPGSIFGNPFKAGETTPAGWREPFASVDVRDAEHAVELLRTYLQWRSEQPVGWCSPIGPHFPWERQIRSLLAGRDLACWCPLDQPCHADVLLEIANGRCP